MRKSLSRKLLVVATAFSMVVGGAGISSLADANVASAAGKAKITLSKTKATVEKGKTLNLKVTTKNVKKVKSITWKTSKKDIATVSKKGKVTAKKAGTAKITCQVKYTVADKKSVQTKKLTCSVTVKETVVVTPTPDPATVPVTGDVTTDTTTLKMTHDNMTNIDPQAEPVTTTVPGGSFEITKKDNGVMRKDITAKDLASTAMGTAVNLGNTLEATISLENKPKVIAGTDETAYDKGWKQPTVTQEYFDMLHSYGINTVRIPVGWSNGDCDDGTYTIDEKLLARVEEVANYALNNGMYVIINNHWDHQWWGGFGACKRDENNKKVTDEARRAETWKRYESYWTQIANRFKDYSDHLMFACANEELGTRLNDGIYPSTGYSSTLTEGEKRVSGNLSRDELYETTNQITQKFVDIIRATGGNNTNRFLVIPGFDTGIDTTVDSRYVMPTDIEENGKNRLFSEVHYYTPWDFCGDGGVGMYSLADQAAHAGFFAPMQRFVDEGYAIILGECGVCAPLSVNGSVTKWFEDVFTICRQYYAVPCLWETGQYFDRSACTLNFYDVANFFNAVNDAQGDNTMSKHTGAVTGDSPYVTDVTGKEPVWSWTGKWYKNGGDFIVGDDRHTPNGGTDVSAEKDTLQYFVPESNINATIDGDKTSIVFDSAGYQAFLKVDMSKYKKPAVKFTFSESSLEIFEDDENFVGRLQLGAIKEADSFKETVGLAYDVFSDRGILLQDELAITETNPYLSIAFSNKPTITRIDIYEMGK